MKPIQRWDAYDFEENDKEGEDGGQWVRHEDYLAAITPQPIATAPREIGVPILAYVPSDSGGVWMEVEWYASCRKVGEWQQTDYGRCHPTHWLPLPPNPEGGQQ